MKNKYQTKNDISFIIPAYNCADTITESVESIFNNNFSTRDEVIIVDDASTDNTLKIIKGLQKKYTVIRIFRHHYNKGSAAAGRNTGIDNSKNDLIFCLDADNVLYPGSIPKLKQFFLSKNADVAAFGELHYFKDNIQNVTHKWIYKGKIMLYDGINNTTTTPCSSGNYLFTKTSWLKAGRYNESFAIIAYDSLAFGLCQLIAGSKMVTMPNSFYYHRYGYESTFVRESRKVNSSLTLLQIILPYINLFDERDIDYIMGKKGRYIWFNNLGKHPLRLNKKQKAKKDSMVVFLNIKNGIKKLRFFNNLKFLKNFYDKWHKKNY